MPPLKNNTSEDGLNLVHSPFSLAHSTFINSTSDSLDIDFSDGTISHSTFTQCLNDCIDISGSNVKVTDVKMSHSKDKAFSAGENSHIKLANIQIDASEIGITSKDPIQCTWPQYTHK